MILRHESVLSFVDCKNDDDARLISLGSSHFDDAGFHTATMQELLIIIRAAMKVVKSINKPFLFQGSTCHTSKLMFVWKLRTVFVNHSTDSSSEVAEFANMSLSHMHWKTVP